MGDDVLLSCSADQFHDGAFFESADEFKRRRRNSSSWLEESGFDARWKTD